MFAAFLERKAITIASMICIAFSFFFQMYIPINANTAWHLQVAMRLLQGKHLYTDIIEVNLPLIYYIRTIPVWLSGWLHTPVWWASVLFNFGVCLMSYCLCLWVIRRSDYKHSRYFLEAHKLALAIVIFILPFWYFYNLFGEKEHLFFVLTLPYILTMLCSKDFWKKDHAIHALIGLMAGIGFCIKPYFVLLFLAAEFYRFFYRRNSIPLIRMEPLVIALFGLGFLATVLIYFPTYLPYIIPMASKVYQHYSWMYFFITPFLTSASIIFVCMIPLWQEKKEFERYYFFLAATCIIIGASLLLPLFYYFLPAFAYCIAIILTRLTHVFWIRGWWEKKYFSSLCIGIVLTVTFTGVFYKSSSQLLNRTVLNRDVQYDGLKSYITEYREKGTIFILGAFEDIFPLVTQEGLTWGADVSTALTVAGSDRYKINHPDMDAKTKSLIQSYYDWYVSVLMKGLTTNPPALFIVNNNTPYPEGSFDHWIGHIERHKKFPEFKKFWKLYKLVGTVPAALPGNPDSTSFSVYERKK